MKILFVASEVDPIIKVGGIADVVSSLSKEINVLGEDVRIIIPLYSPLKKEFSKSLNKVISLKTEINGKEEETVIWETFLPGFQRKIKVYLIANNNYLSNQGVYLNTQSFSYLERFLFFSKAVLEFLKKFSWQPDLIHCHDWQTGIIPLLLKVDKRVQVPVLFTIHNLLVQGQWNYSQVLKFLNLQGVETPSLKYKTKGAYGDDFNVLQQAILNADLISVVSPAYAQEIKTNPYYARGLKDVIQKRKNDLMGILNGIDVKIFNPKTDSLIEKNYSIGQIGLKNLNKKALQRKAGFKLDPKTPLLGLVSRLDIQKGIDLLFKIIDNLVKREINLVFLGKGEKKYEQLLEKAAQKYPNRVSTFIKFDAQLARQIYAGADIFLMPSRFEPCGLGQLIAMRYGSIPVVRGTGGLLNTVENVRLKRMFFKKKEIQGTGFVFNKFSEKEFLKTVKRALKFYSHPQEWQEIIKNAMKKDFSWQRSAKKYLELYKKLIKNNGQN